MSTDTVLGNKDRGRVIDWKRVAESYRDDLCALIRAGNGLRRRLSVAPHCRETEAAMAVECPECGGAHPAAECDNGG